MTWWVGRSQHPCQYWNKESYQQGRMMGGGDHVEHSARIKETRYVVVLDNMLSSSCFLVFSVLLIMIIMDPQRIICRAAELHMVVMFMVICDAYSVIMMNLTVDCMVI